MLEAFAVGSKNRLRYHMVIHLVWDLKNRSSGRNPSVDSVWLEEDYVKYSLRKYRKMHKKTASLNLLRRCLVHQKFRLRGR